MVLLIKKKTNYYRRFHLDIWGLSLLDLRANRYSYKKSFYLQFFYKKYLIWDEGVWKRARRYIYKINVIERRKKKKKWKIRWLSLRLTRLYFLVLKDYQFRLLFRKANKMDGNLESNYCHLLECRFFSIVYRTNYPVNIFDALDFCKKGKICLNFKPTYNLNILVNIGTFISPMRAQKKIIKYSLKNRCKIKAILFNTPRYFYISWRFWFMYIYKKPKRQDFVYPISIDIQRITGYY